MAEIITNSTVQASANSNILELLQNAVTQLQQMLDQFRDQPLTPTAFCDLENRLQSCLRDLGRRSLEWLLTQLEPATREETSPRVQFQRDTYRRRPKQPKTIYSTFGPIEYSRFRYEACERGDPSIFPLDLMLGLEAHLATPALAEHVGRLAVHHEQSQVLAILAREHGVCWAAATLRKVTASLANGMASFREAGQVRQAIHWLQQAFASKGRYRPVLAVGRDGIMIPMRQSGFKEACAATLAIYGRNGKRLGTLYLGTMPEPGQETMTRQLTSLIKKILAAWHARGADCPRLAYLTDGGHHPREFYQRVLRKMIDPWFQDGRKLGWQWVLDFWHACGYVGKLAAALFGDGTKQANAWFGRMRRWLRDRVGGISEVLRSASQHQNQRHLSKTRDEAFCAAYRFLNKHKVWMQYADYRNVGMPIGSGVTEAACKTVFTQRLKRSGMAWKTEGGQVIVDLRILHLSGIWHQVHTDTLDAKPLPIVPSVIPSSTSFFKKAA
jgi:hypothetical protein